MIGLDLLGLGSKYWPIKDTIDLWPEGYALGCFDGEWPSAFGNPIPNIRKLLATKKVPAVRVHIWWSPQHKLVGEALLRKRAKVYQALAEEYSEVDFYLSPSCEYTGCTKTEIKSRVDIIKKHAPACTPVLAPMKAPIVPGCIIEHHGDVKVKGGEIVSHDGAEAADLDIERWKKRNSKALIQFFWSHLFNLREVGEFIPPNQRKTSPDRAYLKDVLGWTIDAGIPPERTFSGSVEPLKRPLLYKIFAEDKLGSDPRANKPLLICPVKESEAKIIGSNGALVAKLGYYDTYLNQGYRYYSFHGTGSRLSSSQIADKAIALTGSPWIWFQVGQKIYGPIHGNRRGPYFQKQG